MKIETTAKVVVIPDIHQNLSFLQRVVAAEDDGEAHFVTLGDYFDAYDVEATGIRIAADGIREIKETLGDRMTLLAGNHDLQYFEAMPRIRRRYGIDRYQIKHGTTAFSGNAAKKIGKSWTDEFIASIKPFVLAHGWILSHAGIHSSFWPDSSSDSESLKQLFERLSSALQNLNQVDPALGGVGTCRGGYQPFGGIAWQDWDKEFEDSLPFPQIVGHTRALKPRITGRSRCIDVCQKGYAVVQAPRGAEQAGPFEFNHSLPVY